MKPREHYTQTHLGEKGLLCALEQEMGFLVIYKYWYLDEQELKLMSLYQNGFEKSVVKVGVVCEYGVQKHL